jgi:hypothetical protein
MAKQDRYRTMATIMVLYMLGGIILLSQQSEEIGNGNLIESLRGDPLALMIVILPIAFFFFFVIKANSAEELKNFLKKDLIKYISKFMGFILTAYVAYYILIPFQIKDFVDLAIFSLVATSLFLVFLLACWFESMEMPELGKKNLKKIWKTLRRTMEPIIFTMIAIFFIYLAFGINWRSAFFISYLHSMFFVIGFSPVIKNKFLRIIGVIVISLFQPFLFIIINGLKPEYLSYNTAIISSITGLILTYTALIFSMVSKKNKIKDYFERSFDQ